MFGYKTILQIDGSNEEYELSSFSYSFSQPMGYDGKAQDEVQAGAMEMAFENLPTPLMSRWMLEPRFYRNGVVKIFGNDGAIIQKIDFQQATCIRMNMNYMESGSGYCMTQLTVQAKSLTTNNYMVENNWKNV